MKLKKDLIEVVDIECDTWTTRSGCYLDVTFTKEQAKKLINLLNQGLKNGS